jgi:hypothetical protein
VAISSILSGKISEVSFEEIEEGMNEYRKDIDTIASKPDYYEQKFKI